MRMMLDEDGRLNVGNRGTGVRGTVKNILKGGGMEKSLGKQKLLKRGHVG